MNIELIAEKSSRLAAAIGMVFFLGILVLAHIRPPKKTICRSIMRSVYFLIVIAILISAFFVLFPTPRSRNQLYHSSLHRWRLFLEPNILNYQARFWGLNENISLAHSDNGIIYTDHRRSDVHVKIYDGGTIEIGSTNIPESLFDRLMRVTVSRFGEFRLFMWTDSNVPDDMLSEIISIMRDAGLNDIYMVRTSPKKESEITFTAVPLANVDNANKVLDPTSGNARSASPEAGQD